MSRLDAINLIKETATTFKRSLGPNCRGLLVYGSALQSHYNPNWSDINLILVVANGFDLHAARQVFQPIWQEHGAVFGRAPLVATQTAHHRFLRLFPALRYHIATHGKPVFGDELTTLNVSRPDKREALAYIADELLKCSMVLAPEMQDEELRASTHRTIGRIARKLRLRGTDRSDTQTLSLLLNHISPKTPPLHSDPNKPYPVEGLVSIYEKLGELFFIVDQAANIVKTDWPAVAKLVEDAGYPKFAVTTPPLFRLLIETVYPADFALLSYNHSWGEDLLTKITVIPSVVLRNAAQVSARYEVDNFANAVLTSEITEKIDGKLIHDYQNKLLNIRLQNELLNRLKLTEKTTPDTLPDRTHPSSERLQAVWERFGWWAEFYLNASHAAET